MLCFPLSAIFYSDMLNVQTAPVRPRQAHRHSPGPSRLPLSAHRGETRSETSACATVSKSVVETFCPCRPAVTAVLIIPRVSKSLRPASDQRLLRDRKLL